MNEKKPYSVPQLFQVELNHEQAILSACSLTAANAMVGGGGTGCRVGACKNGMTGGGSDSGARPS
jgi:hypothetical protein